MEWLYKLEIYQIIFTLAGGGLLVTAVIPALIRWKFKLDPSESFGKGADDAFKLIISITLLLTAFSLVRVQGDHRNAEDLVTREAALVFKLNRALHGYGGQEAAELRVDLLAYAKAIVEDEWPLLETQQRSEVASVLLADMTKGIRMLDPKNMVQQIARGEVISTISQLSDIREARMATTQLGLPSYLRNSLLFAIVVLIVMSWVQTPLLKMVAAVSGVTMGISILMTLLISLENIYKGDSRVTAEPIERILPSIGP
jgi:hypothetical protein